MLDDSFFMMLLAQLARIVPTFLVCAIGIFLLQTRALPKKTKAYGVAGLVLVILGALGSAAFSVYLTGGGIEYSSAGFRYVQMGFGAIMQLLHVASLILLIMAIWQRDGTGTQQNSSENPYQ